MSSVNELLREGIVSKLKEYDAYIDNELPDYIMVMMANNKTMEQVNQDLQLFLGDHTNSFTSWLQQAISNPDILSNMGATEQEPAAVDPGSGPERKRRRSKPEEPDSQKRQTQTEERYHSDEEPPPSPKVSKMRSDRYEQEPPPHKRRSGEHRGEVRVRTERPSIRRYEAPNSRSMAKKTVRAQPDSTRDQDLRQLIGGSRHRGRRLSPPHQEIMERSKGRRGLSEDEEGEVIEGEEEEETGIPTTTVASVVKLVERPSRPRRTDVGGSRLLHRAILGLAPSAKRSKLSRKTEGEKMILVPAHMLAEGAAQQLVVTKKHVRASDGRGGKEDVDGEEEEDEVVVNVANEGEEFEEEELQLEGVTKAVAALKHVVPHGGNIKVVTSSGDVSRGQGKEEGEGEKKDLDLRAIINRSREERTGKPVGGPRFVVTLTGAGEVGKSHAQDQVETEQATAEIRVKQRTLAEAAMESSAVEKVSARRSAKDRLGVRQEEVEEAVKEEADEKPVSTIETLERCRFWPNCKNGDSCPYHHPNVPCKLFPDCKYGNKCLFLHPQCKYNSRCSRVDCPYLHTAPRHMASPQIVPQIMPTPVPMVAPPMFSPPFRPPSSYSFSRGGSSRMRTPRYPNKSAYSWKPHISERKFALPE